MLWNPVYVICAVCGAPVRVVWALPGEDVATGALKIALCLGAIVISAFLLVLVSPIILAYWCLRSMIDCFSAGKHGSAYAFMVGFVAAGGVSLVIVGSLFSDAMASWGRYATTKRFRQRIVGETRLPFCEGTSVSDAPNRIRLLIQTGDGKTVLADSVESAAAGRGEVLSAEGRRLWTERSVKSQVSGHIKSQYCTPIDREFADCRLQPDLRTLHVIVARKWSSYSEHDRAASLDRYYRYLKGSLGFDTAFVEGVIYVRILDQRGKLLAHSRTDASGIGEIDTIGGKTGGPNYIW